MEGYGSHFLVRSLVGHPDHEADATIEYVLEIADPAI